MKSTLSLINNFYLNYPVQQSCILHIQILNDGCNIIFFFWNFFKKIFSHLGFYHRHREQVFPNQFQKLKISNKIIDFSVLDFDLFLCFLDFPKNGLPFSVSLKLTEVLN